MTQQEQYVFNSGEIRLQLWYGPQKESSVIFTPKRFVADKNSDGTILGKFEIGTAIYENSCDIFEKEIDNINPFFDDTFDIVVYPKKFVLDPLIRLDDVFLVNKSISIPGGNSQVTLQYTFSNVEDWQDLPEPIFPLESFNPDPLYRIARAIEALKPELKEVFPTDFVLTVEEYTNFKLNGVLPERYRKEL